MNNNTAEKVALIKKWLKSNNFDAIIVPYEDEYLSEYLPAANKRLAWLTGFTGSAGWAVVAEKKSAIFVDGRYTIQAKNQVTGSLFDHEVLGQLSAADWLIQNFSSEENVRVAFDPKCHSSQWLVTTENALNEHIHLIPLENNPIDLFWEERPKRKKTTVRLLDQAMAGQSSYAKTKMIIETLNRHDAQAAIITQPDSICWLMNVRGDDVPHLPVVLSTAIAHKNGSIDWFLDPSCVPNNFADHCNTNINIFHPDELKHRLQFLHKTTVLLDKKNSNAWFSLQLNELHVKILDVEDPCLLPKACKNATEVEGMKDCHVRDGVAMVKFLTWFDEQINAGNLLNEGQLAVRLSQFRQEDPTLVDLSFSTISAAGANAAMCHYNHLDQAKPANLTLNQFYLVDSGGQYLNGTTDITRTLAVGTLSDPMKKLFTLTLKGHIALSKAVFPQGTTGHQIDAFARQYLWAEGFDYNHGTGHGVGCFLNVHEGPQRISKAVNTQPLLPGMVVSNEPGYYRDEAFGIRIENLELVVEKFSHAQTTFYGFEPLSRCPIDKRCIDVGLLSEDEKTWLNQYHQKVWQDLSPHLDEKVRLWLEQAVCAI